jgi:drug/metabolite transporter (DMT)-like permease
VTLQLFALWALNILLDTTGQMAFKAAATESNAVAGWAAWRYMLRRPWIWVGIGCYCVEFASWLAFVSAMSLSIAVLLSTLNIATVALGARIFFGERPSRMRLIGIGLVALGVGLVGAG